MNIRIQTSDHRPVTYKSKSFSGGERHVQFYHLPECLPAYFQLHCRIDSSDALMDLLLIHNALNQHYQTAVPMRLILPYLPYARQDRVCATGQAFSLQVMAQLLNNMHLEHLQVWDCHSAVGLKLTAAENISPADIIRRCDALVQLLHDPNTVLVCPDKGAIKRCSRIADRYGVKHMVACDKVRDPETGEITHTEVLADNLSGKHAIITDDICDGGSTLLRIAKALKTMHIGSITLYITHGIFRRGLSVFDGWVDHIYTTNSFQQVSHDKLTVIDYDPLLD